MSERKNEIVLFKSSDGEVSLTVEFGKDTAWLTRMQMAELFGVTPQNITLHMKHVYASGELNEAATSKESLLVQMEGNRKTTRNVLFYNLDAVISVGYRVNSARATQFRIWATERLHELIQKGFALEDERLRQGGNGEGRIRNLSRPRNAPAQVRLRQGGRRVPAGRCALKEENVKG